MGRTRKKPDEQPQEPEAAEQVEPEAVAKETAEAVPDEAPVDDAGLEPEAEVAAPVEEASAEEAPVPEAGAAQPDEAVVSEPDAEGAPGAAEDSVEAPKDDEPEAAPAAPAPPRKTRAERKAASEKRATAKRKRVASREAKERKPITRLPKPERARSTPKERRGRVVSSAMDKTIVVRVESVRPHRVYKKVVRRSAKFHAHDPRNEAKVGDLVRIVETRPLSKTKFWRLAEILEAAK
jgi:small subunit ribosomal protein S17